MSDSRRMPLPIFVATNAGATRFAGVRSTASIISKWSITTR